MSSHQFVLFFIAMLAITNPIGNLAIYISLMADSTVQEQRKTAIKSAIAIFIIMLIVTWVGSWILKLFGITIGAFETAGGLIIILLGLNMIHGESFSKQHHSDNEHKSAQKKDSIAVIPMAIPIVAGPGAITTIIVHSHQYHNILDLGLISLLCFVISLILGIAFYFSNWAHKILGDSGTKIASRIMGLILTAIAFQMLGNGLVAMMPGLG